MDGLEQMARTLASNLSRAIKTDGHPAVLDDDRNLSDSLGDLEQFVEGFLVFFYIDITNSNIPCGVILPGRRGEGSAILPVDQHFGSHDRISCEGLSIFHHTPIGLRCNSERPR